MLKIYLAKFGYQSGNVDCYVIMAGDLEEAQDFASEQYGKVKFVDVEPEGHKECQVVEVPAEEGIFYAGHNCC